MESNSAPRQSQIEQITPSLAPSAPTIRSQAFTNPARSLWRNWMRSAHRAILARKARSLRKRLKCRVAAAMGVRYASSCSSDCKAKLRCSGRFHSDGLRRGGHNTVLLPEAAGRRVLQFVRVGRIAKEPDRLRRRRGADRVSLEGTRYQGILSPRHPDLQSEL
jgi:hypothetical protein